MKMKITLLIAIILFCIFWMSNPSFGQSTFEKSTRKNEIGTDVVPLLNQLVKFGVSERGINYSPLYQVTYKRHLPYVSLRLSVGGSAFTVDFNPDDDFKEREQQLYRLRYGVEHRFDAGKRLTAYAGIDGVHEISRHYIHEQYRNAGYRHGREDRSETNGLSPVFGVDYFIGRRITLQTELRLLMYWTTNRNRPVIEAVIENPIGPKPSEKVQKNKTNGIRFTVPNFVNATIKF